MLQAISEPTLHVNPAAKRNVEKLRKPLSRVVAAILVFLLIFTRPRGFGTLPLEMVRIAGYLLVFAGVTGRILCTLHIGGRKNRELCRTGIYSMCRNPLYFFSFLGLVGLCLSAQNLTLAALGAAVFLTYYRMVIRSEEKKLAGLFPVDFPAYVQQVPRFWPRRPSAKGPAELQVDTRIFIRSLSEVVWFLVALAVIQMIGALQSHGLIHPVSCWY